MPSPTDVAVVVIAFNEERTIKDCLSSMMRQTTPLTTEVIVVDDGSTDATAEMVRTLAAAEPRIRLIQHGVNRGRGAARRTGQDSTSAPKIGFVDADVIVPPNWIATCADALSTYDAVSGIATPDGDCVVLVRLFAPSVRVRHHTMAISGGNVMFRASALRLAGFDATARLGEDFRIAHRMSQMGLKLESVPGLVSEHRESKSYLATVKWMWQNGVDAARLPFELNLIRVPDVTWAAWAVALLCAIGLGLASAVSWAVALGVAVGATVAVAFGHAWSRFDPTRRPLRWVAAMIFDIPLIGAYLCGRTYGLPVALGRRHQSSD